MPTKIMVTSHDGAVSIVVDYTDDPDGRMLVTALTTTNTLPTLVECIVTRADTGEEIARWTVPPGAAGSKQNLPNMPAARRRLLAFETRA